jgi:hypothetical protein
MERVQKPTAATPAAHQKKNRSLALSLGGGGGVTCRSSVCRSDGDSDSDSARTHPPTARRRGNPQARTHRSAHVARRFLRTTYDTRHEPSDEQQEGWCDLGCAIVRQRGGLLDGGPTPAGRKDAGREPGRCGYDDPPVPILRDNVPRAHATAPRAAGQCGRTRSGGRRRFRP